MMDVGEWPEKRTAISGSRQGHPLVEAWMQRWWFVQGPLVWVLGGARGVDRQARYVCDRAGWPYVELPAQWDRYGRLVAGRRRNREMYNWSAPDGLLLAFPRGGPGTAHCIGLFERMGRTVYCAREPS